MIKISPIELLSYQKLSNVFDRYDVIVRYITIEKYFSKELTAFELYEKMQSQRYITIEKCYLEDSTIYNEKRFKNTCVKKAKKAKQNFIELIKSFEKGGFDYKFPIVVDRDYRLIDGSYRLACSLYFGLDSVSIKVEKRIKNLDFGLSWFKENGFNEDDLILIKNKLEKFSIS